jgi:hypothetical protein
MNLVAVKPPASRVTAPRKSPELRDLPLSIVSRELPQIFLDYLTDAFSPRAGFLSRPLDELRTNRYEDLHENSIGVYGFGVAEMARELSPGMARKV